VVARDDHTHALGRVYRDHRCQGEVHPSTMHSPAVVYREVRQCYSEAALRHQVGSSDLWVLRRPFAAGLVVANRRQLRLSFCGRRIVEVSVNGL